jgi:transposase
MKEHSNERVVKVVGIDLAKRSFHVYGVDERGQRVIRKTFTRARLREFMAHLPACAVAMEACGSAHYWARLFRTDGHEVRLIAPQFVKPFVKSNKNDAVDAEAICEAAQRPTMRFVAVKTVEQQDIQAIHRMRSLVVEWRTAQVNQIRGLLLEYGIEIPQGRAAVGRGLAEILEDAANGLSDRFRAELRGLAEELRHLDERVAYYDAQIETIAQSHPQAQALMTIPGLGAKGATALVAAVGEDLRLFKNGRGLAAWLGLVPPAFHRRARPVARHQQTRGCLPAAVADSQCPRGLALGGTQGRPHQPVGGGAERTPPHQRRGRGAGQQDRPDRLCGDDDR